MKRAHYGGFTASANVLTATTARATSPPRDSTNI